MFKALIMRHNSKLPIKEKHTLTIEDAVKFIQKEYTEDTRGEVRDGESDKLFARSLTKNCVIYYTSNEKFEKFTNNTVKSIAEEFNWNKSGASVLFSDPSKNNDLYIGVEVINAKSTGNVFNDRSTIPTQPYRVRVENTKYKDELSRIIDTVYVNMGRHISSIKFNGSSLKRGKNLRVGYKKDEDYSNVTVYIETAV